MQVICKTLYIYIIIINIIIIITTIIIVIIIIILLFVYIYRTILIHYSWFRRLRVTKEKSCEKR